MGSNERDQTTQHHPPHISSLVVRPSGSNDGESDRHAAAVAAGDYESAEFSRDRPSFSRSNRLKGDNGSYLFQHYYSPVLFSAEFLLVRVSISELGNEEEKFKSLEKNGHRTRASSSSPARRAYEDHRHSDLNHSGAPPRGREFSSRREASGRHRDYSPPYARGGAGVRPHGRGFDGPEPADSVSRNNNPKVQPRNGDWYCVDPLCRNLNFARREYCNKCKRHRYVPANSPPPPRLLPPPMNFSPRRDFNGYRSPPPRGWPRDYPLPRQDHHTWRDRDRERERDRLHYSDNEHPPSRRIASDWVRSEPFPKPHYERRPPPLSPPLHPPRGGRWGRLPRERSRSRPLREDGPPPPMRGGPPPLRDYRRDNYFERGGRDDGRGGRDRMGNSY